MILPMGRKRPIPATDDGMGVFDGGPGSDTLSFADFMDEDGDGNGVTVDNDRLTAPNLQGDRSLQPGLFRNIENFIGSPMDDTITGENTGPNIIEGGPGMDDLDCWRRPVGHRFLSHSPSSVT